MYEEMVLRRTPAFPSLADAGYVGFTVFAAAALYFLSAKWGGKSRNHEVLDALFIAGAIAYSFYSLILEDALQGLSTPWQITVVLAYPLADTMALSMAIFTLSRAKPRRRLQPALIGGGLALIAIVDGAWIFLTTHGLYESGGPFDLLWHVGFIGIICGIIVRPEEAEASPQEARPAQFVIPLVLSVLLAILVFVDILAFDGLGSVEGSLVAILLVVGGARQTVAMLNNERLRSALAANAASLERANVQLRDASESRRQFLNATAHELSNPLSPLQLQARLLAEPRFAEDGEKRAKSVRIMTQSIRRLNALVEDLLNLARLEAGTMRIRRQPMDVTQVVADAVALFEPAAKEQGVSLEFAAGPAALVESDPDRVTQILSNLFSNALKYTPTGGHVQVRVEPSETHVEVFVQDTGPGMTPEQLAQLFKPFSQVQGEGQQKKGTGLGLYICQTLAERLGGSVGCDSQGPTKGSTFWLRLPKEA